MKTIRAEKMKSIIEKHIRNVSYYDESKAEMMNATKIFFKLFPWLDKDDYKRFVQSDRKSFDIEGVDGFSMQASYGDADKVRLNICANRHYLINIIDGIAEFMVGGKEVDRNTYTTELGKSLDDYLRWHSICKETRKEIKDERAVKEARRRTFKKIADPAKEAWRAGNLERMKQTKMTGGCVMIAIHLATGLAIDYVYKTITEMMIKDGKRRDAFAGVAERHYSKLLEANGWKKHRGDGEGACRFKFTHRH